MNAPLCPCGRVPDGQRPVRCGACASGAHPVACALRKLAAGGSTRVPWEVRDEAPGLPRPRGEGGGGPRARPGGAARSAGADHPHHRPGRGAAPRERARPHVVALRPHPRRDGRAVRLRGVVAPVARRGPGRAGGRVPRDRERPGRASDQEREVPFRPHDQAASRRDAAPHGRYRFNASRSPWVFHHETTRRKYKAGARIRSMRRGLLLAASRAGLPAEFHQHDLRHRRVTTWLEAGHAATIVQDAMGHADLRTTMGSSTTKGPRFSRWLTRSRRRRRSAGWADGGEGAEGRRNRKTPPPMGSEGAFLARILAFRLWKTS